MFGTGNIANKSLEEKFEIFSQNITKKLSEIDKKIQEIAGRVLEKTLLQGAFFTFLIVAAISNSLLITILYSAPDTAFNAVMMLISLIVGAVVFSYTLVFVPYAAISNRAAIINRKG